MAFKYKPCHSVPPLIVPPVLIIYVVDSDNSEELNNIVGVYPIEGILRFRTCVPSLELRLGVVFWLPLKITLYCVHELSVGLLVLPPSPTKHPPVIENVFWSQSKPSSGVFDPIETITPPVIAIEPFESIPSLVVLLQ